MSKKKKFGFDEWSAMIFDSLFKGHKVKMTDTEKKKVKKLWNGGDTNKPKGDKK
tara:strand:- start:546 stop:707 length:162 start_codon:yes stop_codon:yes gene_type:complete